MFHRLRVAIGAIWVATLVAVAIIASNASAGGHASAAPPRVVVQPAPADAGTIKAAVSTLPPVTDTTTPPAALPPVTSAPTTAPPRTAAPTTVAPTIVAPTTAAPRPVPTTAARPAVVTPPAPTTIAGPRGSSSDYTTIGYRWNPCEVVTVTSSGPDIAAVVGELASITGLHLQLVSGPAEITVAWGSVPVGGEIGLTAWKAVGRFLIESGVIISPQAQPYLATVLRHELAHAMGLGHAGRGDEIMYPTVGTTSPTDYQAGDLAGLRSVGASAGC